MQMFMWIFEKKKDWLFGWLNNVYARAHSSDQTYAKEQACIAIDSQIMFFFRVFLTKRKF